MKYIYKSKLAILYFSLESEDCLLDELRLENIPELLSPLVVTCEHWMLFHELIDKLVSIIVLGDVVINSDGEDSASIQLNSSLLLIEDLFLYVGFQEVKRAWRY